MVGILTHDLKIVANNDYKLDVENEYAEFWRVSQLEVIIGALTSVMCGEESQSKFNNLVLECVYMASVRIR